MTREVGVPSSGNARRFAAFISYSHADAAIAAKLQRHLERYRLPKHVATAQAHLGSGIGKIFRDREDLAAAASLSDAICEALAAAEALIIVCSPDARASQWVTQEIELFRKLHPDRPVLAAIVRGEPPDIFPPALLANGQEPLAADLRKEGDGWALGFLKIVAGIAGVPLDALVQRDAQRRVRRVMWITGAALTAVLAMGIMTTLAIQSRNEAARQRASAEGLVEYMLTDLREKLKGVGRQDVMEDVNRRAMTHYQAQGDLSDLSVDALERRARLLHAMGEDDERQGELISAQAKFEEAHKATAALLARHPDNADRIFAHAQSQFYVGLAAWRLGDRAVTERYWRGYRRSAGRLAELEPGTVRSLMELGYSEGNLCDLMLHKNFDVATALKHCRKSVDYEKAALAQSPNDPKILESLANRFGWLADAELANGAPAKAYDARQSEIAIMERLTRIDPRNLEYAIRRSWAANGLAEVLQVQKDYVRSRNALLDARSRLDRMADDNSDNPDFWSQKLRLTHQLIESTLPVNPDEARRHLAEAKVLMRTIDARFDTRNPRFSGLMNAIDAIEKGMKS